MAVTWNYDGASTLVATVTGAVNGEKYELLSDDDDSTVVTGTASGGTVVLTVNDIGGVTTPFPVIVFHGDSSNVSNLDGIVGCNIFNIGTADPSGTGVPYNCTWVYDGGTNVQVTFTAEDGVEYFLSFSGNAGFGGSSGGPYTAGTSQTLSANFSTPTSHDTGVLAVLFPNGAGEYFSDRFITPGSAGSGALGNPTSGGTTPEIVTAPVVTGTSIVGSTLSCSTGTWTNSPTSYAYQWQRDNTGGGSYSAIAAATANSYVLVDADANCNVRCRVTASN